MNCQTCRAEIEELEAGAPLSERAGAHVRVCPECWAFHDERQALRRLVGSLGPIGAPPDFDFRLRARLAAAKSDESQRASWRTFLSSVPAIGLAASFALLVAGFVIYQRARPRQPAAGETVAQRPAQGTVVSDSPRPPDEVAAAGTPEIVKGEDPPVVAGRQPTRRAVVSFTPRRKMTTQSVAKSPQIISNDSSVTGAQETTAEPGQPFGAVVELPVRPASQPVRVSLDERGGARRTVTLEPVVFGSQDFAGRSLTRGGAAQDIW